MTIEICANSFESAKNAQDAGADRIELCSELAVGGITPSYGLLKKVMEQLPIKVNVLIRPRSGNFTYSDDEFEVMKHDIQFCKDLGCSGVVSGVLNADNTIDLERTRELLELAKPMTFTFHRAFDWVVEPLKAAGQLQGIGCYGILTSGQRPTAIQGLDLLVELKTRTRDLVIMPGGGINIDNVTTFKGHGFKEVHFSATTFSKVMDKKPVISMNSTSFFDETLLATSSLEKIKRIIDLVK